MSATTKAPAVPPEAETTLRAAVLRRIRSRPTTRGAAILLAIMVGLALLGPMIAPQNPHDLASLSVMDNRLPPGEAGMTGITYWLGTDSQGRDMLSAILYGLRTSLMVGLTATLGALVIGISAGLLAAQFGGPTTSEASLRSPVPNNPLVASKLGSARNSPLYPLATLSVWSHFGSPEVKPVSGGFQTPIGTHAFGEAPLSPCRLLTAPTASSHQHLQPPHFGSYILCVNADV